MFTRKNAKNRTVFVGNSTDSGLGIFYSVPMPGNKSVGQRLTIKQNGTRVDLTYSQIQSLTKVLNAAKRAAR